ncbi:MAG: hypothetical protein ACREV5_00160 [Steroidobacter sp.]
MNRYPSEQLMTIEEAQRLSDPHTSREADEQRRKVWAWQSVAGVLSQTISDEQIERMERLTRRK